MFKHVLHCIDALGWVTGRTSSLCKTSLNNPFAQHYRRTSTEDEEPRGVVKNIALEL